MVALAWPRLIAFGRGWLRKANHHAAVK
jgi:amino acid transporter